MASLAAVTVVFSLENLASRSLQETLATESYSQLQLEFITASVGGPHVRKWGEILIYALALGPIRKRMMSLRGVNPKVWSV